MTTIAGALEVIFDPKVLSAYSSNATSPANKNPGKVGIGWSTEETSMKPVRPVHTVPARHGARRPYRWSAVAALAALALALASCGGSSSSSSSTPTTSSHAGGTFTILANSSFGTADPAQNYTLEEWQLLIMTHDGLVGFAHQGGSADSKVVPDLSTSVPLPTNGGKTYVF